MSLAEQIVRTLLGEQSFPKRRKLAKPKAIYFSGAGYSGSGMHVVGGGGGLAKGGMGG